MRKLTAWIGSLLLVLAMTEHARAWRWPFVDGQLSENMVIQRDVPAPLWGMANPGTEVSVTVAGLKKLPKGAVTQIVVKAGADGAWEAKIGPFPAGGPCEITVMGFKEGRATNVSYTLDNVMIGDVWLCSGQSNMKMCLQDTANWEEAVAEANHAQLRFNTLGERAELQPLKSIVSGWQACSAESARGFSAVGYYFGASLQSNLSIPIGLINSSWGGTRIQAWMSPMSLRSHISQSHADLDRTEQLMHEVEKGLTIEEIVEAWYAANDAGSKAGRLWSEPGLDTAEWKKVNMPDSYAGMGYAGFRDVVWIRKEVEIPEAWVGREVRVKLDRIRYADTTYFSGTRLGGLEGVWAMRDYIVPAELVKAGTAVIAVRICGDGETGDSSGFFSKDPAALRLEVANPSEAISLAGEWLARQGNTTRESELPHRPDNNTVGALYNGMIAPLTRLPIKGVIWYQGEWNGHEGRHYNQLLSVMVQDWRKRFKSGNFPFLIVQLASNETKTPDEPKEEENGWASVREAQWRVANLLTNCGLATAIDTRGLHPTNKAVLGERLARTAMARVYKKKVAYSGPVFASARPENSAMLVTFKRVTGGQLKAIGEVKGFSIAGDDKKFVWADAAIEGSNVVRVSSSVVPAPKHVRYGWDTSPECTLYDAIGLPALPFRSDMPDDLPAIP